MINLYAEGNKDILTSVLLNDIEELAAKLPTKLSLLLNDSGFLTSIEDNSVTEDKLDDAVKAKLSEKIEVTLTVAVNDDGVMIVGEGGIMTATADKDSKDIAQDIKDGKTVSYVAANIGGVNIYFKNPTIEESLLGDKLEIVTALAALLFLSDKQLFIGYMIHNGTDVTFIQGDVLRENSVSTWNLQDSSVTTEKLAGGSVVTETLADNAVTEDKLDYDLQDELNNLVATQGTLTADENTVGSVKKQIKDAVEGLVGTAPDTLNTLQKIAEEMQNPENNTAQTVLDQVSGKADKATTLEGYGIDDAYTKTAADSTFVKQTESVLYYKEVKDL